MTNLDKKTRAFDVEWCAEDGSCHFCNDLYGKQVMSRAGAPMFLVRNKGGLNRLTGDRKAASGGALVNFQEQRDIIKALVQYLIAQELPAAASYESSRLRHFVC